MSVSNEAAVDLGTVLNRLQVLESNHATTELLAAYATAVDNKDRAALRVLYDDRSVLKSPMGDFHGPDDILGFFEKAWAADPSAKRHFTMNPSTRSVATNIVELRCYFMYVGRSPADSVIGWGNYVCTVDTSGSPVFVEHRISVDIGTTLAAGWTDGVGA